jgi:hypothetical protein
VATEISFQKKIANSNFETKNFGSVGQHWVVD